MKIVRITQSSKVEVRRGTTPSKKDPTNLRPWVMASQTVRIFDIGSSTDSDLFRINIPASVLIEKEGLPPVGYPPGLYAWDLDLYLERRAFDSPILSSDVYLQPLTLELYQSYIARLKSEIEPHLTRLKNNEKP